MSHHFVIVAGNIGAGKSTLTQHLAEALGWRPFYEAFDDNPYLADFYTDMKTWSFHSQVFFLSRRLAHHHSLANHTGHAIQDRSIYEDAEIFAFNLYQRGVMSERDYSTYQALYQGVQNFLPTPSLVLYLQAPVGLLAERIAQRGRHAEQRIAIDYLAQINGLYETWAANWQRCPLLRLATSEVNYLANPAALDSVIAKMRQVLRW
ncbi:MAG: deoxynucleoside kinase [Anaerolineae bacterium]|nr:deoxynucleoside kinase [Anaerolineae bacterium]